MSNTLSIHLPDFLEEADGEIRVTGHRISLFDMLWEYNQGLTAEEMTLRLPTLKRSTIHKVLAFYLDNQPAVDGYLNDLAAALDEKRRRGRPALSVAELQQRLEQIHRTTHNAAQVSY
jgi:uncharacterized protein (DUF433 family)